MKTDISNIIQTRKICRTETTLRSGMVQIDGYAKPVVWFSFLGGGTARIAIHSQVTKADGLLEMAEALRTVGLAMLDEAHKNQS